MRPRSGCATLKLVQGLVIAPVVRGLGLQDAWRVCAGHIRGPRADRAADMHLSIDTILPADSVEFCPHPDASNIFVCGTYKLEEEQNPSPTPSSGSANAGQNQLRTGQCLVFEVDSEQQEIISACVPLNYFHGVLQLQSMYL
jgi:hypothetical protein